MFREFTHQYTALSGRCDVVRPQTIHYSSLSITITIEIEDDEDVVAEMLGIMQIYKIITILVLVLVDYIYIAARVKR